MGILQAGDSLELELARRRMLGEGSPAPVFPSSPHPRIAEDLFIAFLG